MASKYLKYVFSTGAVGEEFGLYIMEKDADYIFDDYYLVYSYDADNFVRIKEQDKVRFMSAAEFKSCKDEYGNEYTGRKLEARLKEAVKAFKEELPIFLEDFHTPVDKTDWES